MYVELPPIKGEVEKGALGGCADQQQRYRPPSRPLVYPHDYETDGLLHIRLGRRSWQPGAKREAIDWNVKESEPAMC